MSSLPTLLLQAAISLLLLVQGNPNMNPALREQAINLANQAIQTATQQTGVPHTNTTDGKMYFSTTFFDFGYTTGESKPDRPEEIILTNGSSATMYIRIHADNQPSWLNTAYATEVLPVSAGGNMGIGVLVNPTGLSVGTYKTELVITGNFSDSPKVIPITLRVYGIKSFSSPLTVSCSVATFNAVAPGATWSAQVSGGQSPYQYSWSMHDDISSYGEGSTQSYALMVNYSSAGTKRATVRVTDTSGNTVSDSCSGTISD